MKIVFMGTPDFAAHHLKALIEDGWNVVGVFSQPDKPKGRGRKIKPTPVKNVALNYGLKVYQPRSVNKNEGFLNLKNCNPDLIITVAYGKLLKPKVFELPGLGTYNVHASLLPKYRGAAPIQRALENDEKETGITIFKIDEGMDSGPIALNKRIEITDTDTFGTLHNRLAVLGVKSLLEFLKLLKTDQVELKEQDHEKATFAPKIEKNDTIIESFNKSCRSIFNKIRAFDPVPGVITKLDGERIKLFKTSVKEGNPSSPGEILAITKQGMIVSCKDGLINIAEIQLAGKNRMSPWQAKAGRLINEGAFLGGNN
ncbi:MAG: methionyl-tRNA formyltransferase [Kosmotoga sp.]|nr:MAG: methionyl-tRNA formyltransferase [Kosmotoga sp.]